MPSCDLTAHSALQRVNANVEVIIITPLRFNELAQLWLTHLSRLIKTVKGEGLPQRCCNTPGPQPAHARRSLECDSFIYPLLSSAYISGSRS